MARLSNTANLGFVPLPDRAAELIATYLSAPNGGRVIDPCAGEGKAIDTIAAAIGIGRKSRYLNELHDARAKACAVVADHVLSCDTLKDLQGTRDFAQLAYLNPPFNSDGREEGGGRLEPKFFRRVVEDGRWVQPGGIVIIVTPQDVLARRESCNHLARCYDEIRIYALPDEIRHFREAVVFGVVRPALRLGPEQHAASKRLLALLTSELPVLEAEAEPLYALPRPQAVKQTIWRDASRGNSTMAQQDVIASGGAWSSKTYRRARSALKRTQLAPLFPLHKPQAALRIAAGAINGALVEIGGVPQRIKGSTLEQVVSWTEEKENPASHVQETHTIVRQVPHVVTLDADGTIRRFVGDKGMAALMASEGTAQALLAAVESAAPPRYRLDMTPDVAAVLDTIKPASGRALAGYEPGLLPMQKHVAAAAHRALTTPDPGWGGQRPHAVIIAAEMGTGKALGVNAKLLTPTGWIGMGDVRLGDQVIGSDGRAHMVTGVYPQGARDLYRVTCSDGSAVECSADHLWLVQSANHRFRGQPGVVLALQEFMHDLKLANGSNRWYLPLVQPVVFDAHELPIDPYVLGVLLGDGYLTSKHIAFASADVEVIASVTAVVSQSGLTVRQRAHYDYSITGARSNPLLRQLRAFGLAGCRAETKFIPPIYQFASLPDRIALLQGLLDADGSVDGANRIEFSTVSPQLMQDVTALVQSLGGTARMSHRLPQYTYHGERRTGQRSYRLTIALPPEISPFRLQRKANRYRLRPKYPPCRAIVAVEHVGRKEAQCIRVDAPDQLYVTDDFILTHNTSIGLAVAEVLRQLEATNI